MLVEGYTDVIALHQAGIPRRRSGSMGTALTDAQVDALARLAPTVLLCHDPDAPARRRSRRASDAIRSFNEAHKLRGFELRVVRAPARAATRRRRPAGRARRRCGAARDASVPLARFEVERALERGDLSAPEGRDDVLRAVAPVVKRLEPGALQYDLIRSPRAACGSPRR